jgi:hypothetical protein
MALTGNLKVALALNETKLTQDFASPTFALSKDYSWKLATSGTGANQADLMFSDQRTLVQSANEDLDLAGALTSPLGTTFVAVKCKALGIFAAAANPGNLTVGRGATNGFPWISAVSAGVVIPPGGGVWWFAPTAGITVVAGTGDLLNIAAAATTGSYVYDVHLLGTSA